MKYFFTLMALLTAIQVFAQDKVTFASGTEISATVLSYSNDAFMVRTSAGDDKTAPARNIRYIIFDSASQPVQNSPKPIVVRAQKKLKTQPYHPDDKKSVKEAGMMCIAVAVTVSNQSTNPVEVTSHSFKLMDADGAMYSVDTIGNVSLDDLEDRVLQNGDDTGGWTGFQIPAATDLTKLKIRFDSTNGVSNWAPIP